MSDPHPTNTINPRQTIQSVQHPLVKEMAALAHKKARGEAGLILVETRHPIEEALKAGLTLTYYFYLAGAEQELESLLPKDFEGIYDVSEPVMKKIATTDSVPPVIAVFQNPQAKLEEFGIKNHQTNKKNSLFVLVDRLQDPGNLGTLIRSAIAFGVDGILLTGNSVDPYSPKVIRASAGLVFACHIFIQTEALEDCIGPLRQQSALTDCQWLFSTGHDHWHQRPALPYRSVDFQKATILVLGNEGQGLNESHFPTDGQETFAAITIPMAVGVESLNVSISGSLMLAEAAHQRQANQ